MMPKDETMDDPLPKMDLEVDLKIATLGTMPGEIITMLEVYSCSRAPSPGGLSDFAPEDCMAKDYSWDYCHPQDNFHQENFHRLINNISLSSDFEGDHHPHPDDPFDCTSLLLLQEVMDPNSTTECILKVEPGLHDAADATDAAQVGEVAAAIEEAIPQCRGHPTLRTLPVHALTIHVMGP